MKASRIRTARIAVFAIVASLLLMLALSACSSSPSSDPVVEIYVQEYEKYVFNINEPLDVEMLDMRLTVKRKSGKIERNVKIEQDMIQDYPKEKPGTVDIEVRYENAKTSFKVEFVESKVVAIRVSKKPDPFEVVQGKALSLEGLELEIEFENGETSYLTEFDEANVFGYDKNLEPGLHAISIAYFNKKIDLEITVKKRMLESIKVSRNQRIGEYLVGESYNPAGLVIEGVYDNEEKAQIEYDLEPDGFEFEFDFSKPNYHSPVKVRYENVEATLYCYVANANIKTIEIVDVSTIETQEIDLLGTPTRYKFSESVPAGVKLDASTGSIKVVYEDGEERVVSLESPQVSIYTQFEENQASNRAIDKRTYRFAKEDKKIHIRYAGLDKVVSFDISVVDPQPEKLTIVGLGNILEKKYYNTSKFDDNMLRYNVFYNNGLEKHPADPSLSIEEQHRSWSKVDGLAKLSSSILTIENNAATARKITYGIGNVSADVKIMVYPRIVIPDTIYLREPEKTYQTVQQIQDSINSVPSVNGGYVSFAIEGGPSDLNKVYMSSASVRYYQGGAEATSFAVGSYTAKVEVDTADLDVPFEVEYAFEVGSDEIEQVEVGIMNGSTFEPLDLTDEISVSNTQAFDIESYYVRRKKAGSSSWEASEAVSTALIYHVRKNGTTLAGQQTTLASGHNVVSIRYYGIVKDMMVFVKSQPTRGIEIIQLPKTRYSIGEDLSIAGLAVATITEDGDMSITSEAISFEDSSKWRFSGYDKNKSGKQTVTIEYTPGLANPKTTSFEVLVGGKQVSSISFNPASDQNKGILTTVDGKDVLPLRHGDILSTTFITKVMNQQGVSVDKVMTLKLDVSYEDGTSDQVDLKAEYIDREAWYNMTMPSGQTNIVKTASILYGGKRTSIDILIDKGITLDAIRIFELPERNAFIQGEDIELAGGVFELEYAIGSQTYRILRNLDSAYSKIYGYNPDPIISEQRVSQAVYVSYLKDSIKTQFEVFTYRKINPSFNVLGLSANYGDALNVEVSIERVEDFDIPEYSLEYEMDGVWGVAAPIYPGEYGVKVIIYGNKYYLSSESIDHKLTIGKKNIVVTLADHASSKEYGDQDPAFSQSDIYFQTKPLEGDVIEYSISRVAGESVGMYLLSIEPDNAAASANRYYNFIIAPTFFEIEAKKFNLAELNIEMTGSSNAIFNIKHKGSIVRRSDYTLYDSLGNEISDLDNVVAGGYYVVFNENYAPYKLLSNDERQYLDPKRVDINVSSSGHGTIVV